MRKKILLYVLIFLILFVVAFVAVKNINQKKDEDLERIVEEFDIIYEDGVKVNTSEALATPKQLENLDIVNIKLSCRNGLSTLLADVVNNSSSPINELNLKVEILNKEQNVIMELKNKIFSLNAGESKELNINVSADIAGAYDFRISKI